VELNLLCLHPMIVAARPLLNKSLTVLADGCLAYR
jgi:hypothetical protein